jgi:hypothetical protein
MRVAIVLMLAAVVLCGCATTGYTLVPSGQVSVSQGTFKIRTSGDWNKAPQGQFGLPQAEGWTRNGPVLDAIYFIGGLPDGQAIAKQRPDDERKVPVFHATMTPQDLTSMIESAYRIRGGVRIFETTAVKPVTFLGQPGVQFDYTFVNEDNVKRRGRSMIAVAGGKLYVMSLNATDLHYFEAALPDFQAMAVSASIGSTVPSKATS